MQSFYYQDLDRAAARTYFMPQRGAALKIRPDTDSKVPSWTAITTAKGEKSMPRKPKILLALSFLGAFGCASVWAEPFSGEQLITDPFGLGLRLLISNEKDDHNPPQSAGEPGSEEQAAADDPGCEQYVQDHHLLELEVERELGCREIDIDGAPVLSAALRAFPAGETPWAAPAENDRPWSETGHEDRGTASGSGSVDGRNNQSPGQAPAAADFMGASTVFFNSLADFMSGFFAAHGSQRTRSSGYASPADGWTVSAPGTGSFGGSQTRGGSGPGAFNPLEDFAGLTAFTGSSTTGDAVRAELPERTSVPETESWVLLGLGLTTLGFFSRRRVFVTVRRRS